MPLRALSYCHFLILWFGIGIWSKIMIVFAGAVLPLLIKHLCRGQECEPSSGQRGTILRRQRMAVDEDRGSTEFGALHHRWTKASDRQSDTRSSRRRVLRIEPRLGLHDRIGGYELQSGCRLRRRRHLHGAFRDPHPPR